MLGVIGNAGGTLTWSDPITGETSTKTAAFMGDLILSTPGCGAPVEAPAGGVRSASGLASPPPPDDNNTATVPVSAVLMPGSDFLQQVELADQPASGICARVKPRTEQEAVLPSPRLGPQYFHQRDVRSDDPFTDLIEPSIPFNLAVMVRNRGYGLARNFRITSAQPQIVGNEKGLLIDNISIHEMIHLVQAGGAFDDGMPDFPVNDMPDLHDRPDTLYLSDGRTNAVQTVAPMRYRRSSRRRMTARQPPTACRFN